MTTKTLTGHDSPDVVGNRERTGLLLLIVADAAFVFSLAFSYLYLRGLNTNKAWITEETTRASQSSIWIITALIALAAISYNWGLSGVRNGNDSRLLLGSVAASVLSLIGLIWQLVQFNSAPYFVPTTSAYTSMLIALAVGNVIHLVLITFVSFGIWNRARQGLYSRNHFWQVRIVGVWFAWVAFSTVIGSLLTMVVNAPGV